MKLVQWAMALAFFTASFDILLVFHIFGTLRFAQITMIVVILCGLAGIMQTGTILWPRGATALVLWCVIQGLLISRSGAPFISVELYGLLLFSIAGLFAALQLYGRSLFVEPLMKLYLYSYVFVACFGLFQLVTPALHLGTYLVQQWVVHGLFPRINGFNNEPSFFATYLILGWITILDLRLSEARIVSGRRWRTILILVTAALILSTSKTAIIFVALEGLLRLSVRFRRSFRRQWPRLRTGSLVFPLPRLRRLAVVAVVCFAAVLSVVVINQVFGFNFLLAGSGLNGTPAHSVLMRQASYNDTREVVSQHPWIGLSLGGVPAAIGALHGSPVNTVEELRLYWGFPIPLDVLAASGILGIIPFLWFFGSITFGERRLIREHWPDERAKWLRALIRALVFEWLCFLADQNILRVYFWFHVTMVVIVGYNLRYSNAERQPAQILARV